MLQESTRPTAVAVDPEIQRALDAIKTPEVQEMVKRLSEHGLAVALPHMHGEDGSFKPLPQDQVVFESMLQVSFPSLGDPVLNDAIPVMWRWSDELEAIGNCALCDFYRHP